MNGARLWIHVGGLQIQPGEFAKILLIVFLAGYLREKREVLAQGRLKDLGPLLADLGRGMLVLLETSDLGSALLYFGIFLAMTYVATGRMVFVLGGLGAVRRRRRDRSTAGGRRASTSGSTPGSTRGATSTRSRYQTVQGLYSIGNGHFGGTGFGKGTFTDTSGTILIPDLKTDMIFSALAQELGLIGISAFLLVYMVFGAARLPDRA